jgi:hypothetical protein
MKPYLIGRSPKVDPFVKTVGGAILMWIDLLSYGLVGSASPT